MSTQRTLFPEYLGTGKRLAAKVAVVTGAGSSGPGVGNGRAAAILMAREGACVGLLDVDLDSAEETRDLIAVEGGSAIAIECDVTQDVACSAAVRSVLGHFSRIDVLLNNVGILGARGTAVDVDPDAWDTGMAVNVKSMVLMAKHCVPAMVQAGGGSVINVASLMGLTGGHPDLLYPTSKGAVIQATRTMAAHHGRDGVRVNCLAPGFVYTPMVATQGMTAEAREDRRAQSLLGTEGTAWDVALAALFLASDESRWITGVTLPVDGGIAAGRPYLTAGRSSEHRGD